MSKKKNAKIKVELTTSCCVVLYACRPQYKTLTGNKWDVIIIMLGTNDAHNDCNEPGARSYYQMLHTTPTPRAWLDLCHVRAAIAYHTSV